MASYLARPFCMDDSADVLARPRRKTPHLMGFCEGWIAPVFSSLSKSTNNFSASISFSSFVISSSGTSRSTTPVIGLMGTPAGVVKDAVVFVGGALDTPLLKRKPATFPYPTREHKVAACGGSGHYHEKHGTSILHTIRITDCKQHLSYSIFQIGMVNTAKKAQTSTEHIRTRFEGI